MKTYCILLASGIGTRFGGDVPKQFVKINGRMVIEYTLDACDCGVFDEIILVVSEQYIDTMASIIQKNRYSIPVRVVGGGASRFESCKRGVDSISENEGLIVIHNGVQPFVKKESFISCIETLRKHPAAISAIPCTYTILRSENGYTVSDVPERKTLYCDMGLEGFTLGALRTIVSESCSATAFSNFVGLALNRGIGPIGMFIGDAANIKITYPEDVVYARERIAREGGSNA